MADIVEWLRHPDPLLLTILAIVGVALPSIPIVLKVLHPTAKRLAWRACTVNLVDRTATTFRGVVIRFREQELTTLSLSRVVLWNNGSQVVKGTDVLTADPLRIEVPQGCRILTAEAIASAPHSIDATLELQPDGRAVQLILPRLGSGDGTVIELLHTATRNHSLIVKGAIEGLSRLHRVGSPGDGDRPQPKSDPGVIGCLLLWLALPIVLPSLPLWLLNKVLLGTIAHLRGRGLTRNSIPIALDVFNDDMTNPQVLRSWQLVDNVRSLCSAMFHRTVSGQLAPIVDADADLEVGCEGQWVAGNRTTVVWGQNCSVLLLVRTRADSTGSRLLQSVLYRARTLSADAVLVVLRHSPNEDVQTYLHRMGARIGIPVEVIVWHPGQSPARLRGALRVLLDAHN